MRIRYNIDKWDYKCIYFISHDYHKSEVIPIIIYTWYYILKLTFDAKYQSSNFILDDEKYFYNNYQDR